MSAPTQSKPSKPTKPETYMAQWRRNRGLDTSIATDEEFVKALEEDKVDHFEIDQNNNGYSCYTRCFYKLKGDIETLYEVPNMRKPRFKFIRKCVGSDLEARKANVSVMEEWEFTHSELWRDNFNAELCYAHINFTHKVPEPDVIVTSTSNAEFTDSLAAGKVANFQIARESCNGKIYTHCFYKLTNDPVEYETSPFISSDFKFDGTNWNFTNKQVWDTKFINDAGSNIISFTSKKVTDVPVIVEVSVVDSNVSTNHIVTSGDIRILSFGFRDVLKDKFAIVVTEINKIAHRLLSNTSGKDPIVNIIYGNDNTIVIKLRIVGESLLQNEIDHKAEEYEAKLAGEIMPFAFHSGLSIFYTDQVAHRNYYRRWRNNDPTFNCERHSKIEFSEALAANQIDHFQITQDCNMGGSYARCFYVLKGLTDVYQVVPLRDPGFRRRGDKWEFTNKELWNTKFDAVMEEYQINFTLKPDAESPPAVLKQVEQHAEIQSWEKSDAGCSARAQEFNKETIEDFKAFQQLLMPIADP